MAKIKLPKVKVSKEKIVKAAPKSTALGLIFLAISLITTLWIYNETHNSYSIFNHFISELGSSDKSPGYLLFSAGLCVSGLLTPVLIVALGLYLDTPLSKFAMIIGVLSGIACVGVGLLPADLYKWEHLTAALTFFIGSLITVALFGLAIFLDNNRKISRWYVLPSLFMVANSVIFLTLPKDAVRTFLTNKKAFVRPEWWDVPFFEWMVLFSLALWMFFVARHLWIQDRREA